MCCSVLQCVTMCCSVLQCFAVYRSVLDVSQCVAVCVKCIGDVLVAYQLKLFGVVCLLLLPCVVSSPVAMRCVLSYCLLPYCHALQCFLLRCVFSYCHALQSFLLGLQFVAVCSICIPDDL